MSGFYLLALVAIWSFLSWGIYRIWRFWKPSTMGKKLVHIVIGLVLLSSWFGWTFWEVAGKKIYWDAKVRELCGKDGGVKIYMRVVLPKDKFDKYGNVHIPSEQKISSKDEYYYKWDTRYYRKTDPEIWRDHICIIRRKDRKILGEAVGYSRRGGDLPGPWEKSSFSCPQSWNIETLIFKKEEKSRDHN